MNRFLLAAASLTVLAACASTSDAPSAPVESAVPAAETASNEFERAMITVEGLEEAGNTPTAIDRLTQLLGDPSLNDNDKAAALLRRGELRVSDTGYATWGAIEDFEEILAVYPLSPAATEAQGQLDYARGKATSLNFLLEHSESTREDVFNALFELGDHDGAIDLMLNSGFTPSNDRLVAMYQIGYLCEDEELTGPAYDAVEPDGTARRLQFCDFGK